MTTASEIIGNASYSPEDNKLRLYPAARLDRETYERVKAAGFRWAPKQELFVAPMWTPEREDLLLALCGEIGDEDTSLVQRAEDRADRFEGYEERRAADAAAAHERVKEITSGIPLGQPILVGHHSECRARRDAQRIERGMTRAVAMWDQAKYWRSRAAGALASAKYKERPDVRHRRIASLESDLRVMQSRYTPDPKTPPHVSEGETYLWCGKGRGGRWVKSSQLDGIRKSCERWEAHYRNRLEYERAMLAEDGGIAADAFAIEVGGRVLVRGEWLVVTRVNRKDGRILSVTTNARYVSVRGIEEVKDYRAPTAEEVAVVKAATKLPPLVNYRKEGFVEITKGQWKAHERAQTGCARRVNPTAEFGAHRQRFIMVRSCLVAAFVSDEKQVQPPAPTPGGPIVLPRERDLPAPAPAVAPAPSTSQGSEIETMRGLLSSGGVSVVAAPQLFPTPAPLAERMVELAGVERGESVLEPSAGTGRLLDAIRAAGGVTTAVEINYKLCEILRSRFDDVRQADFLSCSSETLGLFPRVIMNPPFEGASDIRHIRHAWNFVRAGGRLVALCADGPRQAKVLGAFAEEHGGTYEPLPEGSFLEAGTNVRVAMVVVDKPA